MAALASGNGLAAGNPLKACQDAIAYVNANAKGMPAITSSSFCTQAGNDVTKTVCSGGALAEAMPVATSGRYRVSIHYPVPDSEIADPKISVAGVNDKQPCDRLRVIISVTDPSFFGGIGGTKSYTTSRSATAVSVPGTVKRIPALWLLDPTGCTALDVSGGAKVEVGTDTVAGVVMLDSDGSDCNGTQYTTNVSGSGSRLLARDGTTGGYIGLYALPPAATSCTGRACDPANVASLALQPQPQPLSNRGDPGARGLAVQLQVLLSRLPGPAVARRRSSRRRRCPDTAVRGNYIDDLRTSLRPPTPPRRPATRRSPTALRAERWSIPATTGSTAATSRSATART